MCIRDRLMPRCTEYIAAEIGIMKAGCAFAPLITDYPKDRVWLLYTSVCRHIVEHIVHPAHVPFVVEA